MKIDIKIHSNWKYGAVAFLVDRTDFLEDIKSSRKILGITKLLSHKEAKKWKGIELDKEILKHPIKETSGDLKEAEYFTIHKTKSELITDQLLMKYHKPVTYWLVIHYAILCGEVTDDEFSASAYCKVIYPGEVKEPEVAIIITPDTKLKEIREIYKTAVPETIQEYNKYTLKSSKLTSDTVSNIKRDRRWFWLKKENNSYSAIGKIESENDIDISSEGIKKAIDRFKSHLK